MTMFKAFRLSTGLLCSRQLCSQTRNLPHPGNFLKKKPYKKSDRPSVFGLFKDTKDLDMPMLFSITDNEATQYLENLEEDYKKKLEFLKLEYNILLEEGEMVPTTITDKQWIRLLQVESRRGFGKRLEILYKKEVKKKVTIKLKKKLEENKEKEAGKNSFPYNLLRYNHLDMIDYVPRLVTAMQFGKPLIIDCDYVDYMRYYEIFTTAQQLCSAYALNRDSSHPYNLIFCNSGKGIKIMNEVFNTLQVDEDNLPAIVTEKHYLDLFPREKLVYLSPDSNKILRTFDPTDIYIIGGFVDTFDITCKISIKKAKADHIRHAKIPVDEYFKTKPHSSLTVDQMMKVMVHLKDNKSFKEAIELSYLKRGLQKR